MRDPRTDPRPGDVLRFGPQWQVEDYHVREVGRDYVRYSYSPDGPIYTCSINEWRKWAAGAEVVRRGE